MTTVITDCVAASIPVARMATARSASTRENPRDLDLVFKDWRVLEFWNQKESILMDPAGEQLPLQHGVTGDFQS